MVANPKRSDGPRSNNREDELNNIQDVQRWRNLESTKRRLLAQIMMREVEQKVVLCQTDPFLIQRLFNRLMNGTETPEGVGFKWMGGEYRLIKPECVQVL